MPNAIMTETSAELRLSLTLRIVAKGSLTHPCQQQSQQGWGLQITGLLDRNHEEVGGRVNSSCAHVVQRLKN